MERETPRGLIGNTGPETLKKGEHNLSEVILDAARRLFAEEGYDKVSMRRIAKAIGYSPTTIYLYFKNKSEIFFRLTEEIWQGYIETLDAIRGRTSDPEAVLEKFISSYVDMGVTNPHAYKVGFMRESDIYALPGGHLPEGSNAKRLHTAFSCIVRAAKAKLSPGTKRVDDESVDLAIQTIWSMLHGLTSLLVTYPTYPWKSVEKLKKSILHAAMSSLA